MSIVTNPFLSGPMGGPRQFDLPIDYYHVCEYVSRRTVSLSLICLLMLAGCSFEFQYIHPYKESCPEWIGYLAFYYCLYNWHVRCGGSLEDDKVEILQPTHLSPR